MKECLLGLLSEKTVVYVTHQVEFLPSADLILVSSSAHANLHLCFDFCQVNVFFK